MATIQQQIQVAADPALVSSSWARFIQWAHIGPSRLACDELACMDAVRSGLVEFVPAPSGETTVIFRIDQPENGPSPAELERHLGHDLVLFKHYTENGGHADGSPGETQRAASEVEAGRKGHRPRHVRLSSENDTTFWRSHFPT
jgi:hypothetical protein